VPATLPRLHEVRIDGGVLAFATGLSVLTGLAFGLIPALQSSKVDLTAPIREGSLGAGQSAKAGRWRSMLIMSELALAVVLMVGAGLLLRTLWKLLQENPGFNPEQVVAASVWLPVPNDPKTDKYANPGARTTFLRAVQARLDAVPGVQLASFTSALPTTGQGNSTGIVVEDRPTEPGLRAEFVRITPDYFSVIRSPLMHGRPFAEGDEGGQTGGRHRRRDHGPTLLARPESDRQAAPARRARHRTVVRDRGASCTTSNTTDSIARACRTFTVRSISSAAACSTWPSAPHCR